MQLSWSKLSARLRGKDLGKWSVGYLRHLLSPRRRPTVEGVTHVMFTFCDHYEPLWAQVGDEQGWERVQRLEEQYAQVTGSYRDADGRTPRHTFFFPGEQYRPRFLEALARMARAGLGEVELHVHHDGDTEASLRVMIQTYLEQFAQHGHLARDHDGRLRYAFIHGDWALANSRDGRYCGVDNELQVLWETGCYADFTFPSLPMRGQPPIANQIYWPVGDLNRRCAHDHGRPARVGERMRDRLLLIQGPSALAPRPGYLMRLENGDLQGHDGATPRRVRTWVEQHIHVKGRPEWVFVKVHTHGAPEKNAHHLLSEGAHALHGELTSTFNDGKRYALHYVTAREAYNIALAAMDGHAGDPSRFRDYELKPPPIAASSCEAAEH